MNKKKVEGEIRIAKSWLFLLSKMPDTDVSDSLKHQVIERADGALDLALVALTEDPDPPDFVAPSKPDDPETRLAALESRVGMDATEDGTHEQRLAKLERQWRDAFGS